MKFRFEIDGNQLATWKIKHFYAAGYSNIAPTQLELSLQTLIGYPNVTSSWYSQGGVYDATVTAPNCPTQTLKFYGVGNSIQDSWISDRLKSLYTGGKTPGLLCGVAQKESSYMQYNPNLTRFDLKSKSYWPHESSAGFVGLMQIPYEFYSSWAWGINTEFGANLFREKEGIATYWVKQIRDVLFDQSDLPYIKDEMMENMKLWLYNCENKLCYGKLNQYYLPGCPGSIKFHSNNVETTLDQCTKDKKCMCIGGNWSWKVNDGIPDAVVDGNHIKDPHVNYVSRVRKYAGWRCH